MRKNQIKLIAIILAILFVQSSFVFAQEEKEYEISNLTDIEEAKEPPYDKGDIIDSWTQEEKGLVTKTFPVSYGGINIHVDATVIVKRKALTDSKLETYASGLRKLPGPGGKKKEVPNGQYWTWKEKFLYEIKNDKLDSRLAGKNGWMTKINGYYEGEEIVRRQKKPVSIIYNAVPPEEPRWKSHGYYETREDK